MVNRKAVAIVILIAFVSLIWGCLVAQLNLDAFNCSEVGGKWVNEGVVEYVLHPAEACSLPPGTVRL